MQTSAQEIAYILSCFTFNFSNEKELQRGIAEIFTSRDLPFEREVKLGDAGRIDFLIDGGIGLEVKIKGSLTAMTMQVHRYAQEERVRELVVAAPMRRLSDLPPEMSGKPVVFVPLASGGF